MYLFWAQVGYFQVYWLSVGTGGDTSECFFSLAVYVFILGTGGVFPGVLTVCGNRWGYVWVLFFAGCICIYSRHRWGISRCTDCLWEQVGIRLSAFFRWLYMYLFWAQVGYFQVYWLSVGTGGDTSECNDCVNMSGCHDCAHLGICAGVMTVGVMTGDLSGCDDRVHRWGYIWLSVMNVGFFLGVMAVWTGGEMCVCDDCLCAQVGICLGVMTVCTGGDMSVCDNCVHRWGYVWVWWLCVQVGICLWWLCVQVGICLRWLCVQVGICLCVMTVCSGGDMSVMIVFRWGYVWDDCVFRWGYVRDVCSGGDMLVMTVCSGGDMSVMSVQVGICLWWLCVQVGICLSWLSVMTVCSGGDMSGADSTQHPVRQADALPSLHRPPWALLHSGASGLRGWSQTTLWQDGWEGAMVWQAAQTP